jgi:hypothetical protein
MTRKQPTDKLDYTLPYGGMFICDEIEKETSRAYIIILEQLLDSNQAMLDKAVELLRKLGDNMAEIVPRETVHEVCLLLSQYEQARSEQMV